MPYLDAIMIIDFPKSMRLKTVQVSLGENRTCTNKIKDWTRRINRKNFKVNDHIKVCLNHLENHTSEKIILN